MGICVIGCTPDHGERSHGRAVRRAPCLEDRRKAAPLAAPGFCFNYLLSTMYTQVRPEEISAWLQGYCWGEPVDAWCAVDLHVITTQLCRPHT